jgi:hypothetical protein
MGRKFAEQLNSLQILSKLEKSIHDDIRCLKQSTVMKLCNEEKTFSGFKSFKKDTGHRMNNDNNSCDHNLLLLRKMLRIPKQKYN